MPLRGRVLVWCMQFLRCIPQYFKIMIVTMFLFVQTQIVWAGLELSIELRQTRILDSSASNSQVLRLKYVTLHPAW